MFTPQRKVWLRNPRSEPVKKNGSGSGGNPNLITRNGESAEKGKGVAFVESTPPKGTLGENGMDLEKVSKLENEVRGCFIYVNCFEFWLMICMFDVFFGVLGYLILKVFSFLLLALFFSSTKIG